MNLHIFSSPRYLKGTGYLLCLRNRYNQTARMIQSKTTRITTIHVEDGIPESNTDEGVELGIIVGFSVGEGVLEGVWLGN
jgi:hypothetical protein